MTPEGRVKARIDKILAMYGEDMYAFKPVQQGFGKAAIDYHNAYRGWAFSIEAKAPGEEPTSRQDVTIAKQRRAGIKVFVIDGDYGYNTLHQWLTMVYKLTGGATWEPKC